MPTARFTGEDRWTQIDVWQKEQETREGFRITGYLTWPPGMNRCEESTVDVDYVSD